MDLTQEQADDGYEGPGDFVSMLVALWQLSDGWAAVGEFIGRLSALKWHWPRHTDDPSDGEYC